jgi:hypothetical protein
MDRAECSGDRGASWGAVGNSKDWCKREGRVIKFPKGDIGRYFTQE